MKKVFILIMFSLFMVAGNVAAADLNGTWVGTMYCSDDYGASGEDFEVVITQTGDFFTSVNITPTPGEICGGVIDGNKISMTCPPIPPDGTEGTIAYGEIKGKTYYVINHIPADGKTCKGTATLIKE